MIVKTTAQMDCTHCGLPVPAGLIQSDSNVQFCCSGCSGAYDLIHGNGLESFYAMANSDPAGAIRRSKNTKAPFDDFDQNVFQEKFVKKIGDRESEIEMAIEGVHCGACIWLLEKLPVVVSGVKSATVNWTKRTIRIRWYSEQVKLSQIASTLDQLGYRPAPLLRNGHVQRWQKENRKHLTLIGVAGACAGNNMVISLALYLGMFSHMTAGMTWLLRAASCAVGLVALFWPGRTFLKSAWTALKTKTPHMDLPIALGLTVGTIAGLVNVIRGTGEIYFDSLSVLIFLLLVGRWIQFRQQSIAANSIEMLYRLTPQKARKIVAGQPVETLVDLVEVGDRLQVRAGDLVPVDGVIIEGESQIDESILTGESRAIEKSAGDSVAAGTLNIRSLLLLRATAIGSETRLSQIVGLVEQASLNKPKIVIWANKIGGYFVAVLILLASITFFWWAALDVDIAVDRTVALLIVACPCALALATPLAIAVAIGRAAREKIMVKGGDVLQSLQNPGMIWLDKTGTLTDGDLNVTRWYGDTSWLDRIAVLESRSFHPVAHAIIRFRETNWHPSDDLAGSKLDFNSTLAIEARTSVSDVKEFPGKGVAGCVGDRKIVIGNEKLLAEFEITPSHCHRIIERRITSQGLSPCWIATDTSIVAIAAIGDSIRVDASSAIESLRGRGWDVGILSGDHQLVVDRVARRLKIDSYNAIGGASPEAKLRLVRRSMTNQNVVMVGDGVNDSAALAAATVGIAVKNGAEASLAAAPVYMAKDGLSPILKLINISDSTNLTMRLNLAVSLIYNTMFVVMAFAGYINPLTAAILMPISSLTVVALSLNSGRISAGGVESSRNPSS